MQRSVLTADKHSKMAGRRGGASVGGTLGDALEIRQEGLARVIK